MAEVFDLVITNGLLVTADEVREADIGVQGEKIAAVRGRGGFRDDKIGRLIDAEGGMLMPGGVVREESLNSRGGLC